MKPDFQAEMDINIIFIAEIMSINKPAFGEQEQAYLVLDSK